MLIDDNEDDNFFHSRVIKKSGLNVEVISYNSAEKAIAAMLESKVFPDLIFLDINMPRMNGWEFLEELETSNFEGIKASVIVMLSTSANPDDKEKAAANHFLDDFCVKPLTVESLNKVIDTCF